MSGPRVAGVCGTEKVGWVGQSVGEIEKRLWLSAGILKRPFARCEADPGEISPTVQLVGVLPDRGEAGHGEENLRGAAGRSSAENQRQRDGAKTAATESGSHRFCRGLRTMIVA